MFVSGNYILIILLFIISRQEDAQEFLSFVMDQMHDELLKLEGKIASNRANSSLVSSVEDDEWETVGPKNKSAVTRTQSFLPSELSHIFGGQLKSVVKAKGKDSPLGINIVFLVSLSWFCLYFYFIFWLGGSGGCCILAYLEVSLNLESCFYYISSGVGNKASATIQPFLLLHLDIQPQSVHTIEDALHLFSAAEYLEGYRPTAGKVSHLIYFYSIVDYFSSFILFFGCTISLILGYRTECCLDF